MTAAEIVLLVANCVYATSYVAPRIVLDDVPPATMAFVRLAVAGLALAPLLRATAGGPRLSAADRRAVLAMGVLGFAAAYALSNWGLAHSTATNAALLIAVEPVTLVVLSPLLLGERLRGRERRARLSGLELCARARLRAAGGDLPERPARGRRAPGGGWLGEPLIAFTAAGGALVVASLTLAVPPRGTG